VRLERDAEREALAALDREAGALELEVTSRTELRARARRGELEIIDAQTA
jgi:hypothetical protein